MSAQPIHFPGVPDDEPLEPVPPVSYFDFRLAHPHLWVDNRGGEGGAADWSRLLQLKGAPAISAAYREILKKGGKVFFDKVLAHLAAQDEAAHERDRKAIESLLRTPSAASNKLADMAASDGISDKVGDVVAWAMGKPEILQRLRARGLI